MAKKKSDKLTDLITEYYGEQSVIKDNIGWMVGKSYINANIPCILTPYEITMFNLRRVNSPVPHIDTWYDLSIDDLERVFKFINNENHNVGAICIARVYIKNLYKDLFLRIKKTRRTVKKIYSENGESWCFQVYRDYTCILEDNALIAAGYPVEYVLHDTDCRVCNWR